MRVSFCIKCYNQVDFIGRALQAAFVQTLPPEEIIISDDASTDGSVDLIRKIASARGFKPCSSEESWIARYRKGTQVLVLVCNPRNLGNIGNWQRLCEVATGDILVKADGDDISMSTRVERIVANWGDTDCLVHACTKIDLEGRELGFYEKSDGCHGAVSAYSRRCFTEFGPILYPLAADDEVYLWRARLLNGFKQIHEPLVLYRVGSGFSSIRRDFRKRMHQNYCRTLESRKQTLVDVGERGTMREQVELVLSDEEAMTVLWGDDPWRKRFFAYRHGQRGCFLSKEWMVKTLQLLPRFLGDPLLDRLAFRTRSMVK